MRRRRRRRDWLEPARRRAARRRGPDRRRASAWAAVEDVARLRDGLGVPVPPGVPEAFTEPVADPLGDLVARYARTHGPFTAADVAARLGLGVAVAQQTLLAARRARAGCSRASSGPAARGTEWCDAEVLRRLRRRSLAALRKEVEPVEPADARPVPPGLAARRRLGCAASTACSRVVEQLAGCAVPASALESLVLPAGCVDYAPGDARRADRDRRGALGRRTAPARHRRLGLAAPRRHAPT